MAAGSSSTDLSVLGPNTYFAVELPAALLAATVGGSRSAASRLRSAAPNLSTTATTSEETPVSLPSSNSGSPLIAPVISARYPPADSPQTATLVGSIP